MPCIACLPVARKSCESLVSCTVRGRRVADQVSNKAVMSSFRCHPSLWAPLSPNSLSPPAASSISPSASSISSGRPSTQLNHHAILHSEHLSPQTELRRGKSLLPKLNILDESPKAKLKTSPVDAPARHDRVAEGFIPTLPDIEPPTPDQVRHGPNKNGEFTHSREVRRFPSLL